MKRSEMLGVLEEIYGDLTADYGYFGDVKVAFEEMLDRIEKAGMLPPCDEIINESSGMSSNLYTYDCFCGGNYDTVDLEDLCKWEPEDDA